jgi:carbon monoxide dehydrogenase subunit G
MHFDGRVTINAPRQKVWDFLTDPQAVSECAPGLKSMEVIVPDEKFKAVVSVGFGAMKVSFEAEVEWGEMDPLNSATISAHATAPGSVVDVSSKMNLSSENDEVTQLDWEADVDISGRIKSMASRLMGSVTNKLTGVFFDCVKKKIEA